MEGDLAESVSEANDLELNILLTYLLRCRNYDILYDALCPFSDCFAVDAEKEFAC